LHLKMEGAEPFDNIDGDDDELEQQVSLTNQGLFFFAFNY